MLNNIVLLVTIEKFDANLVLVNVNKLKPYRYMEFEIQKQKQQMPIYWEQSACGVQVENFDMEEDNQGYEIHKPHMKNVENKTQITNPMVNTIFIFDL